MKLIIFNEFNSKLEAYWMELEPTSQHHVFQSYEWLMFWQTTIGVHTLRITPWIAIILDADGCPRMIFPFGIRRCLGAGVFEFLGGGQADYQGPLIHSDWVSDVAKIKAAWDLVCDALPKHDVRHFVKLPAQWYSEDNPVLEIWKTAFQGISYSAQLPKSFDEFRLRLKSKLKSDTQRQRRRISKIGKVEFEVLDNDGKWLVALDTMIEQKRQRYRTTGVPDMLADDAVQQFYRHLPKRFAYDGCVHFSVIKLNDEILATHWGCIYRDRFYFLMPTYANEKWGGYSPGRLLLENLIEWCIKNHVYIFDFTIGGEEYKKDWCNNEMQLFEHLETITPLGLLYLVHVRLRRYARKSKRVWKLVTCIYSLFRHFKRND